MMNRFKVLLLLVALAMAVGYLLGTEQGREKRRQLSGALNRRRGVGAEVEEVLDPGEDAAVE
jgi:hypothetical protein